MGAPVAEDDGRAAGAEQRAGEQEGAVAAAVVVEGDVLVVHDQRCAAGHGLRTQALSDLSVIRPQSHIHLLMMVLCPAAVKCTALSADLHWAEDS